MTTWSLGEGDNNFVTTVQNLKWIKNHSNLCDADNIRRQVVVGSNIDLLFLYVFLLVLVRALVCVCVCVCVYNLT
jgi:hypothetical protein